MTQVRAVGHLDNWHDNPNNTNHICLRATKINLFAYGLYWYFVQLHLKGRVQHFVNSSLTEYTICLHEHTMSLKTVSDCRFLVISAHSLGSSVFLFSCHSSTLISSTSVGSKTLTVLSLSFSPSALLSSFCQLDCPAANLLFIFNLSSHWALHFAVFFPHRCLFALHFCFLCLSNLHIVCCPLF